MLKMGQGGRAIIGLASILLSMFFAQSLCAKPQPGEVYKEFFCRGGFWRVTDREATAPGAPSHLPNTTYQITIDDLDNAIRAEAVVSRWGGHTGTTRRRVAFGYTESQYYDVPEEDWITLPPPSVPMAGTTNRYAPECWMHFDNVDVDIPLSDLTTGQQNFILDCGRQLCFDWDWGQWGFYGLMIRVYYDPATKTFPTGSITSPASGSTVTEDPDVTVSTTGDVEKVDIVGYYEGIDVDGDGIMQEWQELWYRYAYDADEDIYIDYHVGSDDTAPYEATWDTTYVPDQAAGSIKFIARIKGTNGYWYATPIADNISLSRPYESVKLYIDDDLPRNYWVRDNERKQAYIEIPGGDDLSKVDVARIHWITWAEGPASVTFNYQSTANTGGDNHDLRYTIRDLDPALLETGNNRIEIHNTSIHHGCEIMFPGPMLTLRFVEEEPPPPPGVIKARNIFYNNSAWDGYNPVADTDDENAIAPDKQALLPGGSAGGINYTNFDKGINGIMVDIADNEGTLSASDFEFHVGNDSSPAGWSTAPDPVSISTRSGDGVDGSDRVTIIWTDGAITNQWLKVTIKANATTALAADDVFYYGNAIGDTLDQADSTIVDSTDEIAARNDPHTFMRPAPLDHTTDFNRDKRVDATDQIIARNNVTDFSSDLELFTAP